MLQQDNLQKAARLMSLLAEIEDGELSAEIVRALWLLTSEPALREEARVRFDRLYATSRRDRYRSRAP